MVWKKLKAEAVVIANVRVMYQHASMIPAIEIKYILNIKLLSTDINCEYIAINHINILGFKIEILNPCKNEIVLSFIFFLSKFIFSLFKIDFTPMNIKKMIDKIFNPLNIKVLVFIISPKPKIANVA